MKINKDKVRSLRLGKSWSQERLSEVSGLSLRTIQRIENGSSISMDSLKELAKALGVEPVELMIVEKEQPATPVDAVVNVFREFANFFGRASRYEYWWFFLFMILVMAGAAIVHDRLYQVVTLFFIVPFVAVGARRLNDTGRSVWWQLFLLVPFGQVIVLFLMAEKSKDSDDQRKSE